MCYHVEDQRHMKMPTSVSKITPFPYTGQNLALAQRWTLTKVRWDWPAQCHEAPHHRNGPKPLLHTQKSMQKALFPKNKLMCFFCQHGKSLPGQKKRGNQHHPVSRSFWASVMLVLAVKLSAQQTSTNLPARWKRRQDMELCTWTPPELLCLEWLMTRELC